MRAMVPTSAEHGEARRAPRFPIEAPVRFRAGDGEWIEGTTVNISRLGLYLRTSLVPPPPSTIVEIHLALTIPGARGCSHVSCTGRIVRTEPSPVCGETLVAATIDGFRIEPAAGIEDSVREDVAGTHSVKAGNARAEIRARALRGN
jgi:PilZ domain-containing protein